MPITAVHIIHSTKFCIAVPLIVSPPMRRTSRSNHLSLVKLRDCMGAAALLLTLLCILIACNISNLLNEAQPAYLRDFSPACQPAHIYPDYRRALGFPLALFDDNLMPPKAAVRKALKTAKAYLHSDKWWKNPGVKAMRHEMPNVIEALQYASGELIAWTGYMLYEDGATTPEDDPWGYRVAPRDISFPHFKTEGCAPYTWGQASKITAYKLITPYWQHANATPQTTADVSQYCPPFSLATFQDAWRQISTFRVLPYPQIEWNTAVLPPRGVHEFYFHFIFCGFGLLNPVLRSLAV
ncbi:hypothetical protein CC86DRAFT_469914 [Ophiobolus disseminans]|uniref:Uncharacterized protein n=1 Tax=Ophiobolus disseminans TaxID=1469910 RepID=A0A6A6ZNY6_9PLEO|nr:hypothetical protein CC86DRAFT_469914 [Ophiobolus disseminans]